MRFPRVTYSWSYSWKMHLKHKAFCRKLLVVKQSRDIRQSLYLNFEFSSFCLNLFSREELSRELLAKMPLKKFLKNNTKKCILNKKLKHESIKTLSKTYKILKNLFGFDWQAIKHAHHIWSCKITQMKWTFVEQKSCGLYVSIKCGIVLSLEWSFNDQFNQVIHNWY